MAQGIEVGGRKWREWAEYVNLMWPAPRGMKNDMKKEKTGGGTRIKPWFQGGGSPSEVKLKPCHLIIVLSLDTLLSQCIWPKGIWKMAR